MDQPGESAGRGHAGLVRGPGQLVDRLAGADPGLAQVRLGLQSAVSIGAAMGFMWAVDRLARAIEIPRDAGPPLPVLVLLAGMMAMMAGLAVTDPTPRRQAGSGVLMALTMCAAIASGLVIARWPAVLAVFVVLVATSAVYVRRWGPRGFSAGVAAFNGGFVAFFLNGRIGLEDMGWLSAAVVAGTTAFLGIRLTVFTPDPRRQLRRLIRSWTARARRLLALTADVLVDVLSDGDEQRAQASLARRRRQALRLGEITLMVDAALAEAAYGPGPAQHLLTAETALTDAARFAGELAMQPADPHLRGLARDALSATLAHHGEAVPRAATARLRQAARPAAPLSSPAGSLPALRLAAALDVYGSAHERFRCDVEGAADADPEREGLGEDGATAGPPVGLQAGFLPGGGPVNAAASIWRGNDGWLDRVAMPVYLRSTVQIAVATAVALAVGWPLLGQPPYWGVLSIFLGFMGATSTPEQVRRGLYRVLGTALGIVVGDLLARVTGHHLGASVLAVLLALFIGISLLRINYAAMVTAAGIAMAQFYVQLDMLSWDLLLLRLAETAIGMGAFLLVVGLVVPLRSTRVLDVGLGRWFSAQRRVLDLAMDGLRGQPSPDLPAAIREADTAHTALMAALEPMRGRPLSRARNVAEILRWAAAVRLFTRSLARNAASTGTSSAAPAVPLPEATRAVLDRLSRTAAALEDRLTPGGAPGSDRLAWVATKPPPNLVVGLEVAEDLTRLEHALAGLSEVLRRRRAPGRPDAAPIGPHPAVERS